MKIFFSAFDIYYLVLFTAAIVALKMYVGTFPEAEYMKMSWYVMDLFTTQSVQPFSNIICMVLYFGPVVYLVLYKWKSIIEYSRSLGTGFMLFFVANLIQALDAETRHLTFFLPFLFYLVAVTYKDEKFSWPFLAVFIATALLFSKVWFQINTEEFLYSIMNEKVFSNEVHQRYFMHQGRFMSYKYFLIQTPVVIILGVVVYRLLKNQDHVFGKGDPVEKIS